MQLCDKLGLITWSWNGHQYKYSLVLGAKMRWLWLTSSINCSHKNRNSLIDYIFSGNSTKKANKYSPVTDRKEIDTRDIQQMVIETRIEIYLK